MKSMKFITLAGLLIVTLLATNCAKRKNRKVADKLEGAWDLTEYRYDGSKVDLVKKQVMHFYSDPVLEKSNQGEGKIETTYNGYTFVQSFTYSVGNKGNDLVLEIESTGSTSTATASIDKIKRKKLTYVIDDGQAKAEFTFKKRN